MQTYELLEVCEDAKDCIVFQKNEINLDYNGSRKVSALYCETSVKSICD